MNLQILFDAPLAIQIHVYAALAAFFLGALVLWRRKGTKTHKRLGKIWVAIMAVTAISSFFIHQIKLWGNFSPIHLISIGTLVVLMLGVLEARRGDIVNHERSMKGVFIGGLGIAGGLAFMPGRMMFEIVLEPTLEKLFSDNATLGIQGSSNFNIAITFVGLLIAVLIVNRKSLIKSYVNWKASGKTQKLLK